MSNTAFESSNISTMLADTSILRARFIECAFYLMPELECLLIDQYGSTEISPKRALVVAPDGTIFARTSYLDFQCSPWTFPFFQAAYVRVE